MDKENIIEILKKAINEIEWKYSLNYAVAFEQAIKALEVVQKIPDIIRFLERQIEISENEKNGVTMKDDYADGMAYAYKDSLKKIKTTFLEEIE